MHLPSLRLLIVLIPLLSIGASEAIAQQSAARVWNEELLSAIRRNVPNPPGHARNLFHTAVAMYDAWAAYDTIAVGYIHHERDTAGDITSARNEAISYAAYRVLRSRFATGAGSATSLASFDSQLSALGYSTSRILVKHILPNTECVAVTIERERA